MRDETLREVLDAAEALLVATGGVHDLDCDEECVVDDLTAEACELMRMTLRLDRAVQAAREEVRDA